MTESCVQEIELDNPKLNTLIREVESKHGDILTLCELYARDQKLGNEIILGVVDAVFPVIKKRDRQLLVMRLCEVTIKCHRGQVFNVYAFNKFATSLADAHLQKGDFAAFRSACIRENSQYRIEKGCHHLEAHIGIPEQPSAKIFFARISHITNAGISKQRSSTNCKSLSVSLERHETRSTVSRKPIPHAVVRDPSPSPTETSYNSAITSPVPHILNNMSPSILPSTSSSRVPQIQHAFDDSAVALQSLQNKYTYKNLSDLVEPDKKVNIYGVIHTIIKMPREDSKHAIVRLTDETCGPDQEFRVHIFFSRETAFPKLEYGYILRLHRLKERYDVTRSLLVITTCSGQQSTSESPYYTAAVVEYGAVGNVSIDDPQQVLMMNANNYLHYVTQAARSGADIIVFPECGLSTIHLPENRDEIRPILTPIPDPAQRHVPCTDNVGEVPEICMGVVKSEPGSDTNGVPVPVTFEPENNEGDKSHQEDVMVFILNALECPACHEIVTVPVLQCERGHHVCNDCWKQVVSCPLCKRPRSEAHNYVAEAVLEKLLFPCKYRADGCAEVMYQVDKAAHEKMCLFRTFTCLVDDCNQAYSVSEIVQHLKSAHCYLITGSRFCVRKGLKFSFTLCQFTFQSLVHAFFIPGWGLFYLCHKVSWQNTCLWLQMIGRGALNTDFLYSVEVSDKLRSVAYQGPVVLMHADTSQQPNECLVITDISLAALRKSTEFCIKVSLFSLLKDAPTGIHIGK